MARIIELNSPGTEKTVVHEACGAKIGYYPYEIQSHTHYDYGGGSDEVYYIICPHCQEKIIIRKY